MFYFHPGATLPADPHFDNLSRLRICALHPVTTAFHIGLTGKCTASSWNSALRAGARPGAGSKNWSVAKGSDGLPLLANPPYLGVSLPAIWYFCHLCVPGVINVAGPFLRSFSASSSEGTNMSPEA